MITSPDFNQMTPDELAAEVKECVDVANSPAACDDAKRHAQDDLTALTNVIRANLDRIGQDINDLREQLGITTWDKLPEDNEDAQALIDTSRRLYDALREATITRMGLHDFVASFNHKLAGTYTRRDKSSFEYSYDCRLTSEGDYVINLERLDVRDEHSARSEWGGSIELRVRDAHSTEWAAGSVTIYGPELKYTSIDDEQAVRGARLNCSSASDMSPTETRVYVEVLELAAEVAQGWTDRARPHLERQAKLELAESRCRDAERKKERAAKRKVLEMIAQVGDTIRVATRDKKTPITGQLVEVDGASLTVKIKLAWKDEPTVIRFDHVTKIEVKQPPSTRFVTKYSA